MPLIVPHAIVCGLTTLDAFPASEYWWLISVWLGGSFHVSAIDNIFIQGSGTTTIDLRPHFKSTVDGGAGGLFNANIKVAIALGVLNRGTTSLGVDNRIPPAVMRHHCQWRRPGETLVQFHVSLVSPHWRNSDQPGGAMFLRLQTE